MELYTIAKQDRSVNQTEITLWIYVTKEEQTDNENLKKDETTGANTSSSLFGLPVMLALMSPLEIVIWRLIMTLEKLLAKLEKLLDNDYQESLDLYLVGIHTEELDLVPFDKNEINEG